MIVCAITIRNQGFVVSSNGTAIIRISPYATVIADTPSGKSVIADAKAGTPVLRERWAYARGMPSVTANRVANVA